MLGSQALRVYQDLWRRRYPADFEGAGANPFAAVRARRWSYEQVATFADLNEHYLYEVSIDGGTFHVHENLLVAFISAYLERCERNTPAPTN